MENSESTNGALWPNDKLQPVIITYNRAKQLAETLEAFFSAGLSSMQLTILDNASPDNTPEVVRSYQQKWPQLNYVRNYYNIGGCANYLRALEITDSEYCWVIGDDDKWIFEGLPELIEVLGKGEADVIRLGWQVAAAERGTMSTLSELVNTSSSFLGSVSMISSVIARRDFTTRYISEAYFSISDFYPQMVPFYKEATSSAVKVYSLSADFMAHTPSEDRGYFFGDLEWLTYYCRSTRYIQNRRIKERVIADIMSYQRQQFRFRFSWAQNVRIILQLALKPKALGFDQLPYLFSLIGYGVGMRGSVALALIIYLVLPVSFLRRATSYLRSRNGLDGDLGKELQYILEGRTKRQ